MKIFPLFAFFVLSLFAAATKDAGVRLEDIPYPFEVRYINIQNDGQKLEMGYMDLTPKTPNGKNILLLHGKNFTGAYWEESATELSKLGYRVIMPDQIGFGKSSKPENYPYSFRLLAYNTKLLLEHLGVKEAIVIGHSMGGMLATRFAISYPKSVEKLILENPIGLEDWQRRVDFRPFDYWLKKELSATPESMKDYQLKAYYDGIWKEKYNKWVDLQTSPLKSSNYPLAARNQALASLMIFTQPVLYEFADIKAPTLLIIGQRDKTAIGKELADEETKKSLGDYPKLGREANKAIKNSKLIELDGIGHMPHIESFEKFIKNVKDFLNE